MSLEVEQTDQEELEEVFEEPTERQRLVLPPIRIPRLRRAGQLVEPLAVGLGTDGFQRIYVEGKVQERIAEATTLLQNNDPIAGTGQRLNAELFRLGEIASNFTLPHNTATDITGWSLLLLQAFNGWRHYDPNENFAKKAVNFVCTGLACAALRRLPEITLNIFNNPHNIPEAQLATFSLGVLAFAKLGFDFFTDANRWMLRKTRGTISNPKSKFTEEINPEESPMFYSPEAAINNPKKIAEHKKARETARSGHLRKLNDKQAQQNYEQYYQDLLREE